MRFDVLMIGDFRFPGGTSTAVASEAQALARAGYRVGLLPFEGAVLKYPHPVHPRIAALVADGTAALVGPRDRAEAALCLLHHPQVFTRYPAAPFGVRAEQAVLVAHHAPLDGAGAPEYDWAAIAHVVSDLFGPVPWAPVGPKVRDQFAGLPGAPGLTAEDWVNVVDPADWAMARTGFCGARPVIGRHSRPDPLKWPDDRDGFLAAYPDDPQIAVRLMGYGPGQDQIVGRRPRNWQVMPFGAMPVRTFLGSIDIFVYHHSAAWVESFGRTVLEAAASGAAVILPPDFEPLFGPAAIYATPAETREAVLRLHADPDAFARQSARGAAVVADRFCPAAAVERVRARIGPPPPAARPAGVPAPRRGGEATVLFVTSNGVGMGHLTRTLAIARRLPEGVRPHVVSMSRAFGVCAAFGIPAEYLPYHGNVGLDRAEWESALEQEFARILSFQRPQVIAFDGNVPYAGLMAAACADPALWRVWIRRPMWAPGAGAAHLAQEPLFDAVLEPGDLAAVFDRGMTVDSRSRTVPLHPVRLLDEAARLDRAAARADLGLPPEGLAVLLQLGAGNNFDLSAARRAVLDRLGASAETTVVDMEWLIAAAPDDRPAGLRVLKRYPVAGHLAAFDFAVAAPGYNTFHENLAAGLPTIFVPNQNPQQDDQAARADFAAIRGLGLSARCGDPGGLALALERMLDPAARAGLREAMAALPAANGASDAARYLGHLAATRRARP